VIGKALAIIFQLIEIPGTLQFALGSARVVGDFKQIGLRP
jgi:hypothetical protein